MTDWLAEKYGSLDSSLFDTRLAVLDLSTGRTAWLSKFSK